MAVMEEEKERPTDVMMSSSSPSSPSAASAPMEGPSRGLSMGTVVVAAMLATAAIMGGLMQQVQVVQNRHLGDLPSDLPRSFENELVYGNARFVFLTEWAVRVEWSPSGKFEDRPTLIFTEKAEFVRKRKPVRVAVETTGMGSTLVLKTPRIEVLYGNGVQNFTEKPPLQHDTLRVLVRKRPSLFTSYTYGSKDSVNLLGTRRTLDHVNGAAPLEKGLLSRSGYTVINDTASPLVEEDTGGSEIPWVAQRNPEPGYEDLYIFGYGDNYKEMMGLYVQIAGKVPVPPRFSLGYWWSKWWHYSEDEFKELVQEFEANDVPLDVLVIDMDWHLTHYDAMDAGYVDLSGQPVGWTGYTWNASLFPDPERFLTWCHDHGLRTTLNMHPAAGVQPFERAFPAMAEAMGMDPDPTKKNYVPFEISDKKYATNFFDIVLRPIERQGVDFWWLDWQQHHYTAVKNLNPTIWLNHVFFNDMERRRPLQIDRARKNRGMIFHRWGGLGSHRYQVGFSGDVITSWDSLRFQVYFTHTAANVAFGHWSHDIGGFLALVETPPELYTRWFQWGVLSAVLRTHAWRQGFLERRIWKYPQEYQSVMKEAVLFRYSIVPYLYSLNHVFHQTGIAPIYPMYYDYPKDENAYKYKAQFFLGQDLLVAPVVYRRENSPFVNCQVYLPEGEYVAWHTGEAISGPAEIERSAAIEDLPVYVKAGSIIPMARPMRNIAETVENPLLLTVFPGKAFGSREATLYQDDGISTDYKLKDRMGLMTTTMRTTFNEKFNSYDIIVDPAVGGYEGRDDSRAHVVRVVNVPLPKEILIAGIICERHTDDTSPREMSNIFREWSMPRSYVVEDVLGLSRPVWTYDAERFTLEIYRPLRHVITGMHVKINFGEPAEYTKAMEITHSGLYGKLRHIQRIASTRGDNVPQACSDALSAVMKAGRGQQEDWLNTIEKAQSLVNECAEQNTDFAMP